MRQSFFGINVALSGLYTAQRNLDTVGHNISNATTPGYSRQQSVQNASRPIAVLDGTGMIGTGSEVLSVDRIRDEYLDFKYWSENIANGEWTTKSELLGEIETTFGEPSNSGFVTIMNEFFNAYQELAKDPSSPAVRALVREKGVTMAKYFNNTATRFEKLQDDINDKVKLNVDKINSIASQIQQLNKQIYSFELTGNSANDLRDSRTLLVDQLSKMINIQATEVSYGKLPSGADDIHFLITVGGKTLVDHYGLSKLKLEQRTDPPDPPDLPIPGEPLKLNAEDVGNLYEVKWEDGNKLVLTGGELKGLLDVRDGKDGALGLDGTTQSPIYKGIPYYQKKLNEFVQTFAMAFNEGYTNNAGTIVDGKGHVDGYGLDADITGPGTAASGIRFFTRFGTGDLPISSDDFAKDILGIADGTVNGDLVDRYRDLTKGITAKNFTVSSDVMNNTNTIATSDVAGENGNIKILNEIVKVRSNNSLFYEGAPEDFMKSLIAGMGIDAQQANRFQSSQDAIVKQIDNRRMSVSGVELNEEMTSMVKFQQAYNASAKMITTMSEIYDTLINRLGVG
ncbi:MAG: flagellar hook-associated protein FlgK [Ruminiclostridium sp.]